MGVRTDLKPGKEAEDSAACFLQDLGFEILQRNFKYGRKEIDLVCRDGTTVVFVEVKSAKRCSFGDPLEKVSGRKQKNIIEVAESFIQQGNYSTYDFRFDVVSVIKQGATEKIEHIRNAFVIEKGMD